MRACSLVSSPLPSRVRTVTVRSPATDTPRCREGPVYDVDARSSDDEYDIASNPPVRSASSISAAARLLYGVVAPSGVVTTTQGGAAASQCAVVGDGAVPDVNGKEPRVMLRVHDTRCCRRS